MKFLIVKKNGIIKTILLLIVLVLGLFSVNYTGSYAVYSGKSLRKLPIYNVQTSEKKIALSFDAAWGAEKTENILNVLKDYDIKANFFVVGFWAETHKDELKKLADSGRVEIGTHSNTHPHMGKMSKAQIKLELETSVSIIENVIEKKVELFRAPFGEYSDTLLSTAEELGLFTIQWDVDSLDWKNLSATEMSARIIAKADCGSIVLMHNDGKHTVEALPLIIEGLKQKGYSFTTIGELIYRDNYTLDHTGKQIQIRSN